MIHSGIEPFPALSCPDLPCQCALPQGHSTGAAAASPFPLGLSLLLQMCGRAEAWRGLAAHHPPEGGARPPGLPAVLALLCAVIER
jgi:hypothetical protein